uniref:G-protein coupled receptors family 1 profile domain-containing protein n=1 Tax=Romanomermis culicivorax TaxID=13658 RepID=A0A915K2S7_ROMCU
MPKYLESNRFLSVTKNFSISISNNNNDSNFTDDDFYSDDLNITIFGLVFVLIGLIGIVGNLMVVAAVLTDRKMRRSAMNILLVNLALADLGNLLVCTPDIVQKLSQNPEWLLPDIFCPAIRYLQIIFLYTSLLTQVAVSIERYFAIAWPMKVRVFCTRRKLFLWTSTLWIVGSLSASPYFIFSYISVENSPIDRNRYDNETLSSRNRNYSKPMPTRVCSWQSTEQFDLFFKCAECLIYYFIPLIIIVSLYTKISCILRNKRKSPFQNGTNFWLSGRRDGSIESAICQPIKKQKNRSLLPKAELLNQKQQNQVLQKNRSPREKDGTSMTTSHLHNYAEMLKSRQNVIKMLIACGFVYFLGYSPVQIIFLSEILFNSDTRFSLTTRLLLNCLAYTCSATNPLLYSIFSRKFRERFVGIARCSDSDVSATTAKYRRPSLLTVRPLQKSPVDISSSSFTGGDGEDENEYDRPSPFKKKIAAAAADIGDINYSIISGSPQKFHEEAKNVYKLRRYYNFIPFSIASTSLIT